MKILVLSDDFFPYSSGGASEIALGLTLEYAKTGHEILVISTVRNKEQEGRRTIAGNIPVFYLYSKYPNWLRGYYGLYNPQTSKKVASIIDSFRPDVVHAHNIHQYLSYHSLKLSKKRGAKVFLTVHDVMSFQYGKLMTEKYLVPSDSSVRSNFDYRVDFLDNLRAAGKGFNPARNVLIRHYVTFADKIFSVSNALKEALNQNGIRNVETIYNGIRTEDWIADEKEIRQFKKQMEIRNSKLILFGGRLSFAKGIRQMLSAMDRVLQAEPDSKLVIFGDSDRDRRNILQAAPSVAQKNLIFLGWLPREKLKIVYQTADLVVVPSVCFDSFPTVNLEAMACKKPVIATMFGGSREAVLDGETGYIVNPFDMRTLSDRILELLKNPGRAREMGQKGYQRVKSEFDLKKQAEKILTYFRE